MLNNHHFLNIALLALFSMLFVSYVHANNKTKGLYPPDQFARTGSQVLTNRTYIGAHFFTQGSMFDNSDLQKLDTSNQINREVTDDRLAFYSSQLALSLKHRAHDHLLFFAQATYVQFWGHHPQELNDPTNDQDEPRINTNPIFINQLYFVWKFSQGERHEMGISMGRQPFAIGGLMYDYIFHDTLDAVVLQASNKAWGQFRFLILDWYGSGANARQMDQYAHYTFQTEQVEDFNGDVHALRTGFVYSIPEIWPAFQLHSYAFGLRYGAVNNGGADQSQNGELSNQPDQDYVILTGLRCVYKSHIVLGATKLPWHIAVDVAYSRGIDHQQDIAQDILIKGFAFSAETKVQPLPWIEVLAFFFFSQGSQYGSSGQLQNLGFVSFKGQRAGGFLVRDFYGQYATAYTDDDGIDHFTEQKYRASGTLLWTLQTRINLFQKWHVELQYWYYMDTNQTGLTYTEDIEYIPYQSQSRFGENIGQEIDVHIAYKPLSRLSFSVRAGVFLPGLYYQFPSYEPGGITGQDPFWGIQIQAQTQFEIVGGRP